MNNISLHNKQKVTGLRYLALILVFLFSFTAATVHNPKPANACVCCVNCLCVFFAHLDLQLTVLTEHTDTRNFFGTSGVVGLGGIGELGDHERWLVNTFFADYIAPAMMMMTEQMSAVAMHQML